MKEEKIQNEYLPLQEAVKYCHYSQEYLSLRARQKKLRALKFGRNWVTKKEWLEEYLKKVKEYNDQKNNKKIKLISGVQKPVPVLRLGFLVALVFILLISSITFGRSYFKNTFSNLIFSAEVGKTSSVMLKNYFSWLYGRAAKIGQKIVQRYLTVNESLENSLKKSAFSTTQQISRVGKKIAQDYIGANNFLEEKLVIITEGYPSWISFKISGFPKNIVQGYSNANNFFEQKLIKLGRAFGTIPQQISEDYSDVNNLIESKINQGYKAITQLSLPTFPQFSRKVIMPTKTLEAIKPTPEKITEERSSAETIKQGLLVFSRLGQKITKSYQETNAFFEQKLKGLGEAFSTIPGKIVSNYSIANDFFEQKIGQSYKLMTKLFAPIPPQPSPTPKAVVSVPTPEISTPTPEKVVEKTVTPQPTKEGLVVIPSTAEDEEMIKKIKESFSDEVKVNPKDETSGIIIPVFREGEGEKYLYILVPIKN
jgi:hypothetical protein